MTRVGTAPGKVILLGEHAVVFGETALAAALPFGVTVRITPQGSGGFRLVAPGAPDDRRIAEAMALVGRAVGFPGATVEVSSELPIGGGLGSSAAFAVALVRAMAPELPAEQVNRVAFACEELFHGTPSGVDNTVCAHGGIVRFRRGNPPFVERVTPPRKLPIVVALTGKGRQTSAKVASLRKLVEEAPDRWRPLVARLGAIAEGGAGDVRNGDWRALGARMDEAHGLLAECGVSSPELEAIVAAARKAGAFGAKLTGAGGGGAAIAVAEDSAAVAAAIEKAGFSARIVELG